MTPKEFENGGFTLKTHQMFSVHTTPEEFENATITGHVGFVFGKKIGLVNHMNYCYYIVFGRTPFSTPVHLKTKKPACSNSFGLKSVFEELYFHELSFSCFRF